MVSINLVVLAGTISDVPVVKEHIADRPDEVSLRIHVPERGKRVLPLPVWSDEPTVIEAVRHLEKGTDVFVRGCVRRRFFRDGGGGRTVTEVVASEVRPFYPDEV